MAREKWARRSLLSGLGAVAAALTVGTRARAQAPAVFQPARHPQDEWMNALPGKHRTVIDCAAVSAAGTGIFYANNIFIANRSGYQLADSDVAVIVVLRHEATTFAFNDAIWAKYGAVLGKLGRITDPRTNQPPTVNPLNSAEFGSVMTSAGITAPALVKRGAHFAICDMATNRVAGVIASAVGSTAPVAVNRAQEFGYSMLSAG